MGVQWLIFLYMAVVGYSRHDLLSYNDANIILNEEDKFPCDLFNISRYSPTSYNKRKYHRRGKRGGAHTRLKSLSRQHSSIFCEWEEDVEPHDKERSISVIIGNRAPPLQERLFNQISRSRAGKYHNLVPVQITQQSSNIVSPHPNCVVPPSIYVLNPTSLAKPHALQLLESDIVAMSTDIAFITETWYKTHHSTEAVQIKDYTCYRRDRKRRKGGGVALYFKNAFVNMCSVKPVIYQCSTNTDNDLYESLWVYFEYGGLSYFTCCVYHPPKPSYNTNEFCSHIQSCVEHINLTFTSPIIIIAGDFNTLSDAVLCNLGFNNIVLQPTHNGNFLDRIFTSEPIYSCVKVVKSNIGTQHSAIVASNQDFVIDVHKERHKYTLRPSSPEQFASLFNNLVSHPSIIPQFSLPIFDVVLEFNKFYDFLNTVLDQFFPEKTVSISSRDPKHMTPYIKYMCKQKNKLMHRGNVEAASALAGKINKQITKNLSQSFNNVSCNANPREFWKTVNKIRGASPMHYSDTTDNGSIDASVLNKHFALISNDDSYVAPIPKLTCHPPDQTHTFSTVAVFNQLDKLKNTASGPDSIPCWFLKAMSPFLAEPLATLFSASLADGTVPVQWKSANIKPLPKISNPSVPADFRPISLTSILSRTMEKLFIRYFMYPFLLQPSVVPLLQDQYAFKPTGSTTASLISLLNTVSNLLSTNPFVHVIALDFSKAFDSLRHVSVTNTLTKLGIDDQSYNWICNFLDGREHTTTFNNTVSPSEGINASVVQGSPTGPLSFILNMSNLSPRHSQNTFSKYADDCHLIVPASASSTIPDEISHIENWAMNCNLKLNRSKTKEIVFTRPRFNKFLLPPPLPNIERVTTICILGITITDDFSCSPHVDKILHKGHQLLYGFKLLKAHGLRGHDLHNVATSLLRSTIFYASPAWSGFLTRNEINQINALLRKLYRWGLVPRESPLFEELCLEFDANLFRKIEGNENHSLHHLLPPPTTNHYKLRPRAHNFTLPSSCTTLMKKNFINRMLFKNAY